jgi:parallel beta-helix repeat protein
MFGRDRVSYGVLSLTLFIFLLALAVSMTPVTDLDGAAHQPIMTVPGPEMRGMSVAGISHDPILIDGDADFAATALVEGWSGDGSPEYPYIIDGLDIDLRGGYGICISISNTLVSFIVSNCKLTGATGNDGAGICLWNVNNALLNNNTCINNDYGIFLFSSYFNVVNNNNCSDNTRDGITLESSDYNTIADNTCELNTGNGMVLRYSDFNTVANNTFSLNNFGAGIFLIDGSDFNDIQWNALVSYTANAIDNGFSNVFDHNYWSDYSGTDSNEDALGDVPYTFIHNSDSHPLMFLPTTPRWTGELPVDQILEFPYYRYDLDASSPAPIVWTVNDTIHFVIDGSGVLESLGTLPPGNHGLKVTCANVYGFSISITFELTVVLDARNPPGWLTIPTVQVLNYGENLDYQITAIDPSGIDHWELDDTTHFTLAASFFAGGSTARITNNAVLEPGSYGLELTVNDIYGNALSAAFEIIVFSPEEGTPLLHRPELEVSGSFDFLLKEDIHLQLVAMLTYLDTGEPISGATVTFDIYDSDGLILMTGTMVEDLANPGVYIYVTPDTMKDLKLPKGIYLVHARATLPNGAEAVGMIQFHVDPPGTSGPDTLFLSVVAGFGGMVLLDSVLVGRYLLRRRRCNNPA